MIGYRKGILLSIVTLSLLFAKAVPPASADVVTDWDKTACDVVMELKPPPAAIRALAVVETAVY